MRRDRPGGMYRMRGMDGPQAPVVTFDTGDLPDLTPLAGGALVISGVLVLSLAGQPLTAAALRRRLRRPAARPFPPAA